MEEDDTLSANVDDSDPEEGPQLKKSRKKVVKVVEAK
jgi:hypothetical protein